MAFKRKSPKRRAAAVTEFALILPILLILTFGTLELCHVVFLKEKALLAAHEGARSAIRKMSTEAQAADVARRYLAIRGVNMATISGKCIEFNPAPEVAQRLEPVAVTVRIPLAGNSILPNSFYKWLSDSARVESTVVMYKEYEHPSLAK